MEEFNSFYWILWYNDKKILWDFAPHPTRDFIPRPFFSRISCGRGKTGEIRLYVFILNKIFRAEKWIFSPENAVFRK